MANFNSSLFSVEKATEGQDEQSKAFFKPLSLLSSLSTPYPHEHTLMGLAKSLKHKDGILPKTFQRVVGFIFEQKNKIKLKLNLSQNTFDLTPLSSALNLLHQEYTRKSDSLLEKQAYLFDDLFALSQEEILSKDQVDRISLLNRDQRKILNLISKEVPKVLLGKGDYTHYDDIAKSQNKDATLIPSLLAEDLELTPLEKKVALENWIQQWEGKSMFPKKIISREYKTIDGLMEMAEKGLIPINLPLAYSYYIGEIVDSNEWGNLVTLCESHFKEDASIDEDGFQDLVFLAQEGYFQASIVPLYAKRLSTEQLEELKNLNNSFLLSINKRLKFRKP